MKISENQLSWKSDTICRSENAPVIKNKSGIKYEARKMTTQFTKLQQFLSREAMGPIRNRKTVEKNHSEPKNRKNSTKTENRMQNCQNRYIFTSQLLKP